MVRSLSGGLRKGATPITAVKLQVLDGLQGIDGLGVADLTQRPRRLDTSVRIGRADLKGNVTLRMLPGISQCCDQRLHCLRASNLAERLGSISADFHIGFFECVHQRVNSLRITDVAQRTCSPTRHFPIRIPQGIQKAFDVASFFKFFDVAPLHVLTSIHAPSLWCSVRGSTRDRRSVPANFSQCRTSPPCPASLCGHLLQCGPHTCGPQPSKSAIAQVDE